MHIVVVIHPTIDAAIQAIRRAVETLREAGHTVHPRLTFEGGDASRFARDACTAGADLIIAAGGDGTINEIVNGMQQWSGSGEGAGGSMPRLGLVPLGTANDLANALNVPQDPEAAIAAALVSTPVAVDVARVNERFFLNVSTGGFGAEATEEAADEIKQMLGPIAYFITGVRKFVALEPSHARFTCDGDVLYEGPFLILAVGNSRRTGGGNFLTAHADMTDRLLDICIVKDVPRVELMGLMPQLRAGTHVDNPSVIYRKVPRVTVESAAEMSVNADGEPIRASRLEYDISPHRILLMMPQPLEETLPPQSSAPAEAGARLAAPVRG